MGKVSPDLGPLVPIANAELDLLSLPGIAWARVLDMQPVEGKSPAVRRIAFVAGRGAPKALPKGVLERHGIWRVVPVTRAAADTELVQLPVWDEDSLQTAAHALGQEGADCAIDLLPRRVARTVPKRLFATGGQPGGTQKAPDLPKRDEVGVRRSDRDAVSDGGPYELPPGFPPTLVAALERASVADADLVYLSDTLEETRESYAALRHRALAMLAGLQAAGVRTGDILLLDSSVSHLCTAGFLACVLGGFVPAPIGLAGIERDKAVRQRLLGSWQALNSPIVLAAPDAAVALSMPSDELRDVVALDLGTLAKAAEDARPVPCTPDDIAVIILTSGSTGLPKGVQQSHRALLVMNAAFGRRALNLSGGDVFLNWMPLDHVGGLVFLFILPLVLAARQIHCPTGAILTRPVLWPELVDRYRVSVNWAPNFAFGMVADAAVVQRERPWDLSCFRAFVNGGEAVSESLITHFLDTFAGNGMPRSVARPAFGMSETCAGVTLGTLGRAIGAFTSLGPPVAGSSVRIVDEQGRLVKEGELGSVHIHTPQIFSGYYGRPDLTSAVLAGDGWFDTGDVGFIADGELYITGRLRDSININGAKYFAHEIEGVAIGTPGVDRASVAATAVRRADATTDELAIFFSAPAAGDGSDDDVLRALVVSLRQRLARELGLPSQYIIPLAAEDIPRTPIGKIVRPELAKRFAAGVYDARVDRVASILGGPGTCVLPLHEKVWVPVPVAPNERPTAVTGDDILGGAPAEGAVVVQAWPPGEAAHDNAAHLLRLFEAVQSRPSPQRPSRILVVARAGAPSVLSAVVRSFNLLQPGTAWRSVYVDATGDFAAIVRHEVACANEEPEIAWRNGERLAARFQAVQIGSVNQSTTVATGDRWLVAGGLGGLGRVAAERLLAAGAQVLLLGRTPETDLPADKRAALVALQAKGGCMYLSADVGDAPALSAAVAAMEAEWREPIRGAMHFASGDDDAVAGGALDDQALADHVLLRGLIALTHLQRERPGLHILVGGSIVGAVGSRLPAYAAVHAAAAQIAGQAGWSGPVTFLGFSAWTGVGLSRGRTNESLLRADGLVALNEESGALAIEAALRRPGNHWLVGLDEDHPQHAAQVLGPAAPLLRPVVWTTNAAHGGAGLHRDALDRSGWVLQRHVPHIPRLADGAADLDRLNAPDGGPLAKPRDETERRVARIFADVLELGDTAGDLGIHDDFFAAGGDSLRATRLAALLSQRFMIKLPVGAIFEKPTVAALVDQMRLLEPKPGLVDAIARQMAVVEALTPEERAALQARLGGS